MFQLNINEKGGQARLETFEKTEITIGRVQGNDIVLPKGNISKRHSRIVLKDGKFIIVDLKSTNGTYVNGKKITSPQVIKNTDKIYIGDFTIQLANGAIPNASAAEVRDQSLKPLPQAREESIDLFGARGGEESAVPVGSTPKLSSPGLIDDNFDQEFDVGAEPAVKAKGAAVAKRPPPKSPAPPPDDDVEANLDAAVQGNLELGAEFEEGAAEFPSEPSLDPGLESDAAFDPEPEGDPEPEPELEPDLGPELAPLKAPVVPMKAPSARKAPPTLSQPTLPPTPVVSIPSRVPAAKSRPSVSRVALSATEAPRVKAGSLPEDSSPFVGGPAAALLDELLPPILAAGAIAPTQAPRLVAGTQVPPLGHRAAIELLQVTVIDELGLRGVELGLLESLREQIRQAVLATVIRWASAGRIEAEDFDELASEVTREIVDFDAVIDLIRDVQVEEIVITHDRQVWAEREGQLQPTGNSLDGEVAVLGLIRRLSVFGGVSVGPNTQLVDVRLRDGARVVASLPPIAFRGPTLSYRKPTREAFTMNALVENGTLSDGMMRFIDCCMRYQRSILLSLGPGVSASATLNALASRLLEDERVVTIEDGVELNLQHLRNVTALESRGDVTLASLVGHAIVMQPDRALIGNISGPAVYDVFAALAGPLEGSICSYSASSPAEALDRLASVELATVFPQNAEAGRRLVSAACGVILQEHRFPDAFGSRRITRISEVAAENDEVRIQDIFVFRVEGIDENGLVTGSFAPTGYIPRFIEELVERGDAIDTEIFRE